MKTQTLQIEDAQVKPMSTENDEVKNILEVVARFQLDQSLTEAQAAAIDEAARKPPAKVSTKRLPSRKKRNES